MKRARRIRAALTALHPTPRRPPKRGRGSRRRMCGCGMQGHGGEGAGDMYRKRAGGWLKHLDFILLDMLCLQVAFVLAYAVRMGPSSPYADEAYRSMGAVLLLADLCATLLSGGLSGVLRRGRYEEFSAMLRHALLVEAAIIAYLFTAQGGYPYSRFVVYLTGVLYVGLGHFARCLWKALLSRRAGAAERSSLLVVTERALAERALADAMGQDPARCLVTGAAVLDCDMRGQSILGVPVVAGDGDVAEAVCGSWVDEALVVLPRERPYPGELAGQLAGMGVVVHVCVFREEEAAGLRQSVGHFGDYTVLTTSISEATPLQQMAKRALDIVGGAAGCLATAVLSLFLAPAIYIASPGPVFFSQERVGRNGRRFRIYKFRSMYMDAEERKKELMARNQVDGGLMFKMEADPRIIGCRVLPDGTVRKGIGNFIRDWSLDEFPQFLNVLKGDMSLVGTRPPTLDEWERYEPHHRARLAVRPGITGLWQVSGRSRITDFEEVVRLDTKYIVEWSMALDLKILLRTVKVVLGRDGSM